MNQPAETKEIVVHSDYNVSDVIDRVNAVGDLFRKVMRDGEHFGKIPGTDKPTLLKPGAEKIIAMFSLAPKTENKEIRELGNGHREYIITIGLYKKQSGEFWGDGSGSCSTMESKYRYRWIMSQNKPEQEEADRLKAQGLGKWKKIDGKWQWFYRIENTDLADTYNTVLKMSEKRSLVSAVLKATGVSDIFTQDMEDVTEHEQDTAPEQAPKEKPEPPKNTKQAAMDKLKALPEDIRQGFKHLGLMSNHVWQFCEDRQWNNDQIKKDINRLLDERAAQSA